MVSQSVFAECVAFGSLELRDPGQAMAIFHAERKLVEIMIRCVDGHAEERRWIVYLVNYINQ